MTRLLPRVLHVIDEITLTGGAETSLKQMVPLLAARGLLQGVVTLRPPEDAATARGWADAGIPVFVGKGTRVRHAAPCIRDALHKFRPDVVHSTLFNADLAARLATRPARVPVIVSVVSAPFSSAAFATSPSPKKLRMVLAAERFLARHMTEHFHAVSNTVAEEAIRTLGIEAGKISVIPRTRPRDRLGYPTPERRLRARQQLGLKDEPLVLAVGRQDTVKNHAALIATFSLVRRNCPTAVLAIAGRRGNATEQIDNAIRDSPDASHVLVLGQRDDTAELLCAADVVACSSLWEGMPGAVLEAMAMERPTAAFEIPAVVEALGETGLLAPIGDIRALAAQIVSLIVDQAERERLGHLARERFEREYAADAVVSATLEMYTRVSAGTAYHRISA